MAEHTPGPWEVIHDAKHPLNKRITSRAKVHIAKVYATALNVDGGCDANARLIAAAPDLLEACQQMVAQFCTAVRGTADKDVICEAAAAIRKAKGDAP